MAKKERSKVTKAKAVNKTKVVQRVTVNIGGRSRGGRKSTAPQTTQRPPPVQIFNSMAGPVPQGQGESMLQSTQILNRLLEPVNRRLDALVGRQAEPQPVAPPPAQRMPLGQQLAEDNNREIVAEQPVRQLVQPVQPIVSAGPIRLDNPQGNVGQAMAKAESADGPQPSINYDRIMEMIEQSEGVGVGQKPSLPNQYTKDGFLQFVSRATGRPFTPTKTLPFNALKARALQFIRDLRR
jgi:hypothetical protein